MRTITTAGRKVQILAPEAPPKLTASPRALRRIRTYHFISPWKSTITGSRLRRKPILRLQRPPSSTVLRPLSERLQ